MTRKRQKDNPGCKENEARDGARDADRRKGVSKRNGIEPGLVAGLARIAMIANNPLFYDGARAGDTA